VPRNAQFILDVRAGRLQGSPSSGAARHLLPEGEGHQARPAADFSFGTLIADWPVSDIVGLWKYLAKHGSQLGGLSAPRFLRMVGKDSFNLTPYVLSALKHWKLYDGTGKGKRGTDDSIIPERHGVLRHQVPQWLRLPPLNALVLQIAPAHRSHGGDGAYYVYLRRARG
jgi:hypothetical protein